ncbi:MAG: hypothetical protein ABFD92_08170 [Planctomycetaceae bacterium]|nr:hypothetical protein [Planctomycetaceae bacterium]
MITALIERFRAATASRKFWYVVWLLSIAGLAAWLVSNPIRGKLPAWDVVPLLLGAVLMAIFATVHELYRRTWGTVGMVAVAMASMIGNITIRLEGGLFGTRTILTSLLTVAGAWFFWRDRGKDDQLFRVPGELGAAAKDLERLLGRGHEAYRCFVGRSMLGQTSRVADWLERVYEDHATGKVTALFVEMERFDINTDLWTIQGFAFSMPAEELMEDLEYNLGEYDSALEETLALTGMEDLQAVFARAREQDSSTEPEQSYAFDLMTVRMQQLIAAAHKELARRDHEAARVRLFANAHDTCWVPLCSPAIKGKHPHTSSDRRG